MPFEALEFIAHLQEDESRFHVPLAELVVLSLDPNSQLTTRDGNAVPILHAQTPAERHDALLLRAQTLIDSKP